MKIKSGKEKTDYRKTKEWKAFRLSILKERNYKCECCGVSKKSGLQIHHIFPEEYDNLEPERFAVLCSSCHKEVSRMERLKHYENYDQQWLSFYGRFVGNWIYFQAGKF
jgi:5-methylcytosine-specific restriction endonuclease McrA